MKRDKPIISMDIITDRYVTLGYKGIELRKVLEKDKEYQLFLEARKRNIIKKYNLTPAEKKKYFMPSDRDYEILEKCKQLKKLRLSKEDKRIVKLILTQLYDDWRKPLIQELNRLFKKYKWNPK